MCVCVRVCDRLSLSLSLSLSQSFSLSLSLSLSNLEFMTFGNHLIYMFLPAQFAPSKGLESASL